MPSRRRPRSAERGRDGGGAGDVQPRDIWAWWGARICCRRAAVRSVMPASRLWTCRRAWMRSAWVAGRARSGYLPGESAVGGHSGCPATGAGDSGHQFAFGRFMPPPTCTRQTSAYGIVDLFSCGRHTRPAFSSVRGHETLWKGHRHQERSWRHGPVVPAGLMGAHFRNALWVRRGRFYTLDPAGTSLPPTPRVTYKNAEGQYGKSAISARLLPAAAPRTHAGTGVSDFPVM